MVVVPFDSAFAPAEPGGTAPTYNQLKETAVAWVRYAAGRVKYWEIGNESYRGSWNGTPTREQYIAGLIDFSRAMKQADPTIQIGANGRDMAWWQAVIQQAGDAIDFLSVHDYPVWNWSGYDSYRIYSGSLASLAKIAGGAIETYGTPAQKTRLWVAVTELNVLDYGSPGWHGPRAGAGPEPGRASHAATRAVCVDLEHALDNVRDGTTSRVRCPHEPEHSSTDRGGVAPDVDGDTADGDSDDE
jgi:hypothetical protein